jgi:hypothetical protein
MDSVKITDNVINEESFKSYYEKSSLFNKLTFEDLMVNLTTEKNNVEKEAIIVQ